MTEPGEGSRGLSPWWRHATILVMIAGFSVLSIVTVLTYTNAPPIPGRVADSGGATLFDQQAILHGQEVFLKYGLMEQGTLWGHGAYLGPDYSAEYLHRLAEICRDRGAREGILKENRYDPATDTLVFSPCEAASLEIQGREWNEYFRGRTPAPGLPPLFIKDPAEVRDLNTYFAWATWATVANRPGKDYSYTNNWPYEPLVGNRPTSSTYLWSALSLITLLSGNAGTLPRQRPRHVEADAEPVGHGEVLRGGRGALPAAGSRGRSARPLSGRVGVLLRHRHRVPAALFADAVFLLLGVAPILLAALRSLAKRDAPRAARAFV